MLGATTRPTPPGPASPRARRGLLHRRRTEHRVLRMKGRTEREERYVRNTLAPADIEERLVRTVSDAVRVLDARDVGALDAP